VSENLLGNRPEHKLRQTFTTMRADNHQIDTFLINHSLHLHPDIAIADDDLVAQTRKLATRYQPVLDLPRVSPCQLGSFGYGIWTDQFKSQGGYHMHQIELRIVVTGYGDCVAERFLRSR
jgi:hypothetical protein